ncbi:hypothetical protein BpHYR1_020645 [Brachionus plicatilis]|uniref:Uncharacterized protein n=1 Tax=Brachionus plicatilis TaxID=10195 RepID=A0A3M7QCG3_BRAPC|nr:hypothetical protein BpHYR1_020645 [Brachionus plicatilis]
MSLFKFKNSRPIIKTCSVLKSDKINYTVLLTRRISFINHKQIILKIDYQKISQRLSFYFDQFQEIEYQESKEKNIFNFSVLFHYAKTPQLKSKE